MPSYPRDLRRAAYRNLEAGEALRQTRRFEVARYLFGIILRSDGRYDMPDLFRVAARLLKKGGVSPG